jgi:chromosome segregation ATPase
MPYVATEHPQIHRDVDSRGLVVTDSRALLKARAERGTAKRMVQLAQQREEFDARMHSLSDRLDRCESILQELVHHITTLVSRTASGEPPTQE